MSDFAGETQKGDKTTADGRLLALAILAAGWKWDQKQMNALVATLDKFVSHAEG